MLALLTHLLHLQHGRRASLDHRSPRAPTGSLPGTMGSDDGAAVGVGPHPRPWPDDPRLDPELLEHGDRRNVADRYRYWTVEAIRDDLRARSHPFHVAIENWQHDFNIGAVVRNANAFAARAVHIVGRRRWNRRGAMRTEAYLDVHHHGDVGALADSAAEGGLALIGIDNLPGAAPLPVAPLPRACVLLFGQEGPGLSAAARDRVSQAAPPPPPRARSEAPLPSRSRGPGA
jgi:tRNA(Leu) C34 or U34 (ribose-2'-O)-methylase TrmL